MSDHDPLEKPPAATRCNVQPRCTFSAWRHSRARHRHARRARTSLGQSAARAGGGGHGGSSSSTPQNGIELMAQRMLAVRRRARHLGAAHRRQQDRRRADVDLPALLAQLREVFGKECLPLNLPADGGTNVSSTASSRPRGPEADFSVVWPTRTGRWWNRSSRWMPTFVDRYLTDGDVDAARAARAAGAGAARGPSDSRCASARAPRPARVSAELLDGHRQAPDAQPRPRATRPTVPGRRRGPSAAPHARRAVDPAAKHVLAHVFKIVGRPLPRQAWACCACTRARVAQGRPAVRRPCAANPSSVAHLFMLQGAKEHVDIDECAAGRSSCAVAKVDDITLRRRAARRGRRTSTSF